jgi:N utilization substance protein A
MQIETSEFLAAIKQISAEKDLPDERVFEVVEAALGAAYRKEYLEGDTRVICLFDTEKLKANYFQIFKVVEEVTNHDYEKSLEEAKVINKKVKLDEEIKVALPDKSEFGRIAAQTAKQVILQKIREIEKDEAYTAFKDKSGRIVVGRVQKVEGRNVLVDLGKAIAILIPAEQNPTEDYSPGRRLRVLIKSVELTPKGPSILISRADPTLIKALFKTEVPEIAAGIVKIQDIVREAGYRTKMSVEATDEGIDPVGSCVGQRGTRVQTVLNEIGGEEKIDIILYNKDPKTYIANALSPAKTKEIKLNKTKKHAEVLVDPDQLSLAIGREGRNVRLASKLTGYEIDVFGFEDGKKIKSNLSKVDREAAEAKKELAELDKKEATKKTADKPKEEIKTETPAEEKSEK